MKQQFAKWTSLAAFAATCFAFASAQAESIGPLPYASLADSPFNLSGLGSTFFVDDFSSPPHVFFRELPPYGYRYPFANLSTPGVEISGTTGWNGNRLSTVGGCTNSIPPSCGSGLGVEFNEVELGFLPQAVGFVVSGFGRVGLSAIDAQGMPIGTASTEYDPFGVIPEPPPGEIVVLPPPPTVFIGVTSLDGIAKIVIGSNQAILELDDLQYGLLVPEPMSVNIMIGGFVLSAIRHRRRIAVT